MNISQAPTEEQFEQLTGLLRSKCMRILKITAEKPVDINEGVLEENDTEGKVCMVYLFCCNLI